MTEVVILKNIPGKRKGAVVTLDDTNRRFLESNILAGNAKVIPNPHGDWNDDAPAPAPAPVVAEAFSSDDAIELDADGADEEE